MTDSNELYERHRITVDAGQEPQRIDKYLQMRLSGVSRNKIQTAVDADCVLVNERPAKASYKIKPGDVISVLLPYPPPPTEVLPEEMPLDIVYEDPYLLVVNKPAGLVVHPAVGNFTGTLLNGLLYHLTHSSGLTHSSVSRADSSPNLGEQPRILLAADNASDRGSHSSPKLGEVARRAGGVCQPAVDKEREVYPFLVHRIDKDTSGLLVVAKDEATQAGLARQFFYHTTERKYLALVWGNFDDNDGTIEGNLERHPADRRIVHVTPDPDRGKHAVTHWHVLERFGYVTLVECILETGRTHQIRAHMKHIGHPLFSDAAYGGDAILKGTTFSKYKQFVENCFALCPRQALHAQVLGFDHPATGQHLHFEQPLPPDMAALLDKWRAYTAATR